MRKLVILQDDLHNRLKQLSEEKGLSINGLIRMILKEYIKSHEEPHKPQVLRSKRV